MSTAEEVKYYEAPAGFSESGGPSRLPGVGYFVLDVPDIVQEDDQRILATLRPTDSGAWTYGAMEGIPLVNGAVYCATGDLAYHTEVLYDELLGIVFSGDAIRISPRPVRDLLTEDPWSYDQSLWTHLVDAFRRALGVEDDRQAGEVARLARACQELSGLNDSQLAAMFPGEVRRETFNRWKNAIAARPTPGNLRRLGLLHRFLQELATRVGEPRTWLLRPMAGTTQSPYDLLKEGRLDQAEELLWALGEAGEGPAEPVPPPGPSPLRLDDDAPPIDDEEGDYVDTELEEDDDG